MGRKSKKNVHKQLKAKPKITFAKIVKTRWAEKHPILLFVMGFLVLISLFYVIISSDYFDSYLHPAITNINAKISGFFLNILGQQTLVNGSIISSSEFSINVAFGCDAIEPCAIIASLILAFPAPFLKKIPGLLLGILLLLLLNLIRIISLFIIGIYIPFAFEIMHIDVWQVVFILFAVAGWFFWIQWSMKKVNPV